MFNAASLYVLILASPSQGDDGYKQRLLALFDLWTPLPL